MLKKTTTAIAMLATLVLTSVATSAAIIDLFDDGVPGGNWKRTIDTIQVKEQGRLKTRSMQPGGGERFSGYKADRWKVVYTENFAISMNYNVEPPSVTGSRRAGIGFRFVPSGDIDEVRILVEQTRTQLRVWYQVTDGEQQITRKAVINATRGQLKVRYRANADRLDILIDGEVVKQIDDFLDDVNVGTGEMRVEVGAFRTGRVMWDWNDLWLDRVIINGAVVD